MIRLAYEKDRQAWDSFVLSSPASSFLQTWAWGDLQAELGQTFWRYIIEDGQSIKAVVLIIKRALPLGACWLYIPGFCSPVSGEAWQVLQAELLKLGKKENAMFIRLDGLADNNFLPTDWQKSAREVQPKDTLLLDITKTEDELLLAMHAKTRYNIRLAEKHGVTVRFSTEAKDVDAFMILANQVSSRSAFHYHPVGYYRALMNVLGTSGQAEIAVAEYNGRPLAIHIMAYAGTKATYIHGASSTEEKKLMASHLLYWETIKRAKTKGCATFDFYGIAPENANDTHPWAGVTRMKIGFGGQRVSYMGAYDLVLKPFWYMVMNLVKKTVKYKT